MPSRAIATAEGQGRACRHGSVDPVVSAVQASAYCVSSRLFVAMDWRRSRSVLAAPRWPHGHRYDGADEEDRNAHAYRYGGAGSPARNIRGSTVASVAA